MSRDRRGMILADTSCVISATSMAFVRLHAIPFLARFALRFHLLLGLLHSILKPGAESFPGRQNDISYSAFAFGIPIQHPLRYDFIDLRFAHNRVQPINCLLATCVTHSRVLP